MAKFKRSVQAIGFRPEQVSERNISQLQAYSDRIANALREERDAVISNRNRTADAMKENAQIEAQQSATNQKIQQQNLQTQFEEQTLLSQKALNDFEVKNAASNAFFSTVASLSTTAAKKLKEYERARNQKQYDNDLAEMLMLGENSPKYKAIEAMLLDANAEELKANTELAQAQERGLDPAEADRYARTFAELSPGNQMGYLKILANKYNYFLTDQASADDTGSARDGQKAAVFAATKLDEFMKIQGVKGITPALLQKSGFLPTVLEVNQRYRQTADAAYREDYKADFSDNFNATLANLSPADGVNFIQTKWPELVRLYGKTGALDQLEGLAKVVDSEGNPLVPTASIMGAKIGPKGETFGEYWGKRREAVEIALAQGANAIHRLDTATQDREAYQLVDGAIIPSIEALLADAPPSEDLSILETAEREVLKKTGGVLPKNWTDYKRNILNENKQEAQAKFNQAQALLGTGEPANINKARELIYNISDPTLRKEAITAYNTVTNPIQLSSDNKKTLDKSISAVSRELLDQSLEGGASNTALRLAGYIRTDAYNMYKEEFKKTGGDQALALANVQARLEQEKVKAKAGEKGARFRTATGKYNQTTFPGFEAEDKITQGQRDARLTSITNTVGSIGVSALHSPGLLSEKELRLASEASEQNVSLNQIATKEMLAIKKALQTQGKTVTFGEIYNAQIAAHNANNPDNPIRPVGISPMLQIMDYAHGPTLDAIANNATTANVARSIAESSPGGKLLSQNLRVPFTSGNTGTSTGPHGDFRVKDLATGQFIDPTPFLRRLTVNGKPLTEQFTMTSPFGMRTHPVHGGRRMHNGVDYGMPVGTKVDVDGDFLERVYDPGGGNMNIYTFTENGRKYEMWALHGK